MGGHDQYPENSIHLINVHLNPDGREGWKADVAELQEHILSSKGTAIGVRSATERGDAPQATNNDNAHMAPLEQMRRGQSSGPARRSANFARIFQGKSTFF